MMAGDLLNVGAEEHVGAKADLNIGAMLGDYVVDDGNGV